VFALFGMAQSTHSIRGVTVDSIVKINLPATVSVLNAKDSILVNFTHSAPDGTFVINGLPAGNFLLMVSHPNHQAFLQQFVLEPAAGQHDFGTIKLMPPPHELKEVTIQGGVNAIKIKGDTIEYNAKAYVIQPNDRVEDLLRQLPGITIDKDGHITAQGEKVQKVLVDGEEFFGDDPTLVTRNIRADMVDKLQLYDAKSAQAAFTGIDDGVKIKTINVQLKEDKKTGIFGKADAGIGNDHYYEGQLIYNKFKPKEKFALYSTASNDGKIGLGYEDNNKVGASDVQINDNGSAAVSFGNTDQLDNPAYNGIGVPVSKTGGVHLDDKWDKDKQSINTNYKIGSLGLTTDENQLSQRTIGPSTVNNTVLDQHSYNYTFRQKLDATYNNILSPTANLKLSFNATDRHINLLSDNNASVTDGTGSLLTTSAVNRNNEERTKILNADIFYTKRFKKAGRTFSWDINEVYSHDNQTNYFTSDTYTAKNLTNAIVDQYKPGVTSSLILNNSLTWSEPIFSNLALAVNYGFALNNSLSELESFNASSPKVYNVLDSVNSSRYKVNQITNQLGAVFNYRWGGNKKVLTFGAKANDVNFKQINEYTNNTLIRDYINWKPQVTFRNQISQGQTYNLNYNGTSVQPGIYQLQPITTNTNPLYITIGNPNLEPSFVHSFNGNYKYNKKLTGQFFTVNGNISFRENPIISNTITDTLTGITTTRYENLKHNTPYNYSLSVNADLGFGGLSLSTYGGVNYFYNNGILTKSNITNYSIRANLEGYKEKAYSIYLSGGPVFSVNQSSPHTPTDNNSIGYNINTFVQVFLPGKFQIGSTFDDTYTGKTQSLPSTNFAKLYASIDKTFFKGDNLKLSLSCNNILNQEQSFRGAYQTTIYQTNYNTIKRYFMFAVTWDFTKFGTAPAKK
jgi:hypothetical protein